MGTYGLFPRHTFVPKACKHFARACILLRALAAIVFGGHPVPAHNNCMLHPDWRGVAWLPTVPTRPLPNPWPHGMFELSRVQVTATLVHDTWLTGAAVYGVPESAAYSRNTTMSNLCNAQSTMYGVMERRSPIWGCWALAFASAPDGLSSCTRRH